MKLELYNIIPSLQSYIKAICSIEYSGDDNAKSTFRVLPDTCVEVFFNFANDTIVKIESTAPFNSSGSFVTSRMRKYMDVEIYPNSCWIAVCFKPGAAYNFFKLPMKELSDYTINLADLWNTKDYQFEREITRCKNNNERVFAIQQFLQKLLHDGFKNNDEYEYCLWQINLYKGQIPIKVLSKKTNISQRQLSRQFKANLGLSPKEF